MIDYYGPNMQAVLRECTRLGIDWESDGLGKLTHKLNRLTDAHVSDSDEIEAAASQWLMALQSRPSR